MFVVVVVLKLHLKFPSRGGKGGGEEKMERKKKKSIFPFISSPPHRLVFARPFARTLSLSLSPF
jgi:hypothetical protein